MYKVLALVALVIGGLPGALAGVLFALNSGFIDPNIALGGAFSLSRQGRRGNGSN